MMLVRVIANILLWVLMAPWATQLSIYVNFKINQDYISEFLCIERDQPMSVCNGNCNLTEELSKTSEHSDQNPPTIPSVKLEWIVIPNEDDKIEHSSIKLNEANPLISSLGHVLSGYSLRLLRPPQL